MLVESEVINRHVTHLVVGWRERVEYTVKVGHDFEARVRTVRHPALLAQLANAHQLTINSGGGGSNPNKQSSRPPGDFQALTIVDELREAGQFWHQRLYEECGGTAKLPPRSTVITLTSLVPLAQKLDHTHPSVLRECSKTLGGHVKRARMRLGYDRPQKLLADTVCGECGGALAVADDASTDVRCIGTPETVSCGVRYDRYRWIELLGP